jgi:ubiquinone/menaquinone biosynthesis C-methylase UbiE
MTREMTDYLVCPRTGSKLTRSGDYLINASGDHYPIVGCLPDLTVITDPNKNQFVIDHFKRLASSYDDYYHLNYDTFHEREEDVRNAMIDRLRLRPDQKVLELGAGTGRDTVLIARRLSSAGELHAQDISLDMLEVLQKKAAGLDTPVYLTLSNAARLPYSDRYFDAVYTFGGVVPEWFDCHSFFREVARVTKPGGRVVVGNRGIAPWLRSTDFAKIIINQNEKYLDEPDLRALPVEAREVSVSWVLSGVLFVIDFTIGEGEPQANFDYEIPGARGGTYLTRFYGQLEGVTPATKELALKARAKLGVSMHQWLDRLVRAEAERILKDD